MNLTEGRLTPAPGSDGLVCRSVGAVLFVAARTPVTDVQRLVQVVAENQEPVPGRQLARHLAALLGTDDVDLPPFALVASSTAGVYVRVYGAVEVRLTGEAGEEVVSAAGSVTGVDRELAGPFHTIVAHRAADPAPTAVFDVDLRAGTTAGAGFALTTLTSPTDAVIAEVPPPVDLGTGTGLPPVIESEPPAFEAEAPMRPPVEPAPFGAETPPAPRAAEDVPTPDADAVHDASPGPIDRPTAAFTTAELRDATAGEPDPGLGGTPDAGPPTGAGPEAVGATDWGAAAAQPAWGSAAPDTTPPPPAEPSPPPVMEPAATPPPAYEPPTQATPAYGTPVPAGDPGPAAPAAAEFTSQLLGALDQEEPERREALPVEMDPAEIRAPEQSTQEVLVQGVICSRGHFNDPRSRFCSSCGIGMVQNTQVLTRGPRPPLGVMVFEDGSTFSLSMDYVVGRQPDVSELVRDGLAMGLTVDDPERSISRAHAELRLVEWDVHLVNLSQTNGSFVWDETAQQWVPIPPGQSVMLTPGMRVALGRRSAVFESSLVR